MSVKDKILERGKEAKRRVIEIETKGGDVLSFTLPFGGPERASYRRRRAEFIEMHKFKPHLPWLQKGWIPEEGYGPDELGAIFDMKALCTSENWTEEDVLELFAVNDVEMIAIGNNLGLSIIEMMGKDAEADIEAKKQSTPEAEQPTGGHEAA